MPTGGHHGKTGYRWRAERGGVPPVRLGEDACSHRYLSLLERQRIAALRAQGVGFREIACRLDRAPSTVSREVVCNVRPHDGDRYDRRRRHASIGQVTPVDFEQRCSESTAERQQAG